ncbi:polysaccharide pyruvyl transferase family protein [Eggerthellaceae bacterium 24-137]
MNIGLISINMYTKGLNYACPVHTFAFQQFLLSHGIENTVIDYKPNYYGNFESRYPANLYRRLVERQEKAIAAGKVLDADALARLHKHRKKAEGYGALEEERALRHDRFWDFIDKYYIKTDRTYDSDLLEIEDPGFDCYICVTDVIWKYQDVEGFDRGYFLGSTAMENKWKIAYSASRGVPKEFDDNQYRQFFYYVEDIDAISVRERSLQELIETESDKTAQLVMDPVLLNDASLYESVAVKPEEEGYVLVYYAEERSANTMRKAVEYAKERGLKVVETTNLPMPGGELSGNDEVESVFRYDIGPAEWLGYIQHADCVFTNSFHGTCFSILFEREFYVGSRHGDKIANLLQTLGLENRQLNPKASEPLPSSEPIDYPRVKALLSEATKSSAEFILGAIKSFEGKKRPTKDYQWWKREQTYQIAYDSGLGQPAQMSLSCNVVGTITNRADGSIVLRSQAASVNDGLSRFARSPFFRTDAAPSGWYMQFKIDNTSFWYLEDGSFTPTSQWSENDPIPRKIFKTRDRIPYIPVNGISSMTATVATWSNIESGPRELIVNSGCKTAVAGQNSTYGEVAVLPSGSREYRLENGWLNNGECLIDPNAFTRKDFILSGWRLRIRIGGEWHWILENGDAHPVKSWKADRHGKRLVVLPNAAIPVIPSHSIEAIAVEALWKADPSIGGKLKRAVKRLTGFQGSSK